MRARDGRRSVDVLLQNSHGGRCEVPRRRRPLSEGTLASGSAGCPRDGSQALAAGRRPQLGSRARNPSTYQFQSNRCRCTAEGEAGRRGAGDSTGTAECAAMLALRCLKPPAELCSSRRLMMLACPPAGGKKSERIMVLNDNIQRAGLRGLPFGTALWNSNTAADDISGGPHCGVMVCMQIPLIISP